MQLQKDKSTSAQVAITRQQLAMTRLQPTSELSKREDEFFLMIIDSRETASWNKNDLFLATTLAKMYLQLEVMQEELGTEFTVANPRGTPVANPLLSSLSSMSGTVQSLNRALGISASQRSLTSEEQKKRNEADGQAKSVVEKSKGIPLLA